MKKRILLALCAIVFNKVKYPIYESKNCFGEKHVDLLLIQEEGKRDYDLIKDFNTFMYDHALHHGRKHFLLLLFTSFEYRKKGEYAIFKNYERKIKSPL